jgi:hypothetical protein
MQATEEKKKKVDKRKKPKGYDDATGKARYESTAEWKAERTARISRDYKVFKQYAFSSMYVASNCLSLMLSGKPSDIDPETEKIACTYKQSKALYSIFFSTHLNPDYLKKCMDCLRQLEHIDTATSKPEPVVAKVVTTETPTAETPRGADNMEYEYEKAREIEEPDWLRETCPMPGKPEPMKISMEI